MKLAEDIYNLLEKSDGVEYEFEESDVLKISSVRTGEILTILFTEKEHIMQLQNWHWHFDNDEAGYRELVEVINKIISNETHIKISIKNGREYNWELELDGSDNDPVKNYNTGLFSINFFGKKETTYKLFQFV
jgi:hypothetical protein